MARLTFPVTEVKGPYETSIGANAADLTFTATVVADKAQCALDGNIIVLCQNTDVGAQTVTFTSAADAYNRTNDITTYSIGAGEIAAFEFSPHGWKQSDGNLYFEASHIGVKFCVLKK